MANYCFAAPLLPGGLDAMKAWIKSGIQDNKGHDSVFRAAGITREQVWLEHTPDGDIAVVSLEVKDPAKAFRMVATSKDPWGAQFQAFVQRAHGIDISKPMPPNELLVDWKS
jgi:hypothetical protein